jgi:hypothetical protein
MPNAATHLAVGERTAAVWDWEPSTPVLLVDLSDPARPTVASRLKSPARGPALAFSGHHLIMAADRALTVIDVSSPAAPAILGRLQLRGL